MLRDLGLSMTKKDLETFFRIRNLAKKSKTSVKEVSNYFQIVKDTSSLKGLVLYQYIYDFLKIKPHRTTVRYWFTGVYDPERVYPKEQVFEIIFQSLAYKRRIENGTIYKSKQ